MELLVCVRACAVGVGVGFDFGFGFDNIAIQLVAKIIFT